MALQLNLIPYEDFKENETIKYGTAATSASANKAPLFIKNEMNTLYNYVKMKFSEAPFAWDARASYKIGDAVEYLTKVYIATSDNANHEPPGTAWDEFDTSTLDLDLKYLSINSSKYINLKTRNSYMMMRSGTNATTAIMSPKNGLIPWDNGTSSDLGRTDMKWNNIYCDKGHYEHLTTNIINAGSGTISTLNSTTVNATKLNGEVHGSHGYITTLESTTVNATKLNGEVHSSHGYITTLESGSISTNAISAVTIDVHDLRADSFSASTADISNIHAHDIDATTVTATTFNGTASKARYADIAEKYTADVEYAPGTVLGFGGEQEITIYNEGMTLAGVVSTAPGYMLNSEIDGTYIALKGRVPCKIVGSAVKGQFIIANNNGFGTAVNDYTFEESKKLLGVAISDSENGIVEIKV
jgi:hypothetical protein